MRCSSLGFAVLMALSSVAAGCESTSDGDDPFAGAGSGGSITPPPAGMSGGGGAGGTTGGGGAAGMVVDNAPNAPEPMCLAMEGGGRCAACACTPNAMGGCLTEQENCIKNHADPMANMLCAAVLKCARDNKCTGMSCVGPCLAQISAAAMYGLDPMGGAGGGGGGGGMEAGGAGGMGGAGAGGEGGGGGMSGAGAGGSGGSGGNMAFMVEAGAGGMSGEGGGGGMSGGGGMGGGGGESGGGGASGAGGMSGGGAGAGGLGGGPNALMAATASGMCTAMKCAGACP